jgi:hypothetical protein
MTPDRIEAGGNAPTHCCNVPTIHYTRTANLAIRRCPSCGSLRAVHLQPAIGRSPWSGASVTEEYKEALRMRRARQASSIIRRYGSVLRLGPILDYGCGQGAFLSSLLEHGIDGYGCDMSLSQCISDLPREKLLLVPEPWAIPESSQFTACTLLDVLEHASEPQIILGRLAISGLTYVLIKVPLVTGPVGTLARVLKRAGSLALLEQLFLTGEQAPHQWYFTREGIIRLCNSQGLFYRGELRLADVGAELPQRIRFANARSAIPRIGMAGFGALLEATAKVWSDTSVFLFESRFAPGNSVETPPQASQAL